MQGRRIEDPGDRFAAAQDGRLKEGDYFKDAEGGWNVCVPNCDPSCPSHITNNGPGNANWSVTEHEDGTITVSPSILVRSNIERYHGHLVRGEWRSC